ncbi:MAG TPA: hypothetical protein VK801_15515 [Caulobacteraceae bacterium]|jgi:hypothetical protein|nr:hypothetical protein [Caulobacteraceae bacterium]
MNGSRLTASCSCGAVEIEAVGRPIAAVICYCDDCQAAARQVEAMPGAPSFRESDGGTSFVVCRKDRIRSVRGESLLTKLKLRDNSPTNRKIATCCNSVMVLDFDDGKHWVDIYSARVKGSAPRPEALVCTKFAPEPLNNPDHIQASSGYSPRVMFKILKARVEMLVSG